MEKITQLYNEWRELQPLKPEYQKRLDKKFRLEFNYNSNHIEGNTLTYGQTQLLLIFGEVTGNASMRDYEEMKAHNVGLQLILNLAEDKTQELTEYFIRDLNRVILVDDFYKTSPAGHRYQVHIGNYKTRPNSVITQTGEEFSYASPEETPVMMYELVRWVNEELQKDNLSAIELAALFHYRYIRIHPFEDGNGRIARLLTNYLLKYHDYPMVIVRSNDKENYLQVLHQCDINAGLTPSDGATATIEQIRPFVIYLENQLERALQLSIKAAKGESIEEEDDFNKQIELLKRRATSTGKPKFSKEQVRHVLENFYFPLESAIIKALAPAKDLFSDNDQSNIILTTRDLAVLNEAQLKGPSSQDEYHISIAKEMRFSYELRKPKVEYNLGDLSISLQHTIRFEQDHYLVSCLDNKQFDYETYPTEEERKYIVSDYQEKVKNEIERVIEQNKDNTSKTPNL